MGAETRAPLCGDGAALLHECLQGAGRGGESKRRSSKFQIQMAHPLLPALRLEATSVLCKRTVAIMRSTVMALFMYQFAYTSESWAAQIKNPENRIETVGRKVCEAAGGKFVAGWLCLGEYDAVFIADVPDIESMSAIALAVVAGGAIKSGKTTPLLSGTQGIEALKKVEKVNQVYKPAR
jgi:uncharacterized protein with GYD domain